MQLSWLSLALAGQGKRVSVPLGRWSECVHSRCVGSKCHMFVAMVHEGKADSYILFTIKTI